MPCRVTLNPHSSPVVGIRHFTETIRPLDPFYRDLERLSAHGSYLAHYLGAKEWSLDLADSKIHRLNLHPCSFCLFFHSHHQ